MTNVIVADLKALLAKIEDALKPVETDVKEIGEVALNYIKTHGLQDLYQIALTAVGGAVTGSPWTTILASIEEAGIAAGKAIEKGAVAVVAAQAQADLIAAGALLPPVASTSAQ